jgi:DNA-binding transcriptional ArsR family regulator
MEEKDAVRALAALAQAARLQLVRAVEEAGPAGMTPGNMAEGAGIPPATLSFHLKELANAGLVTQERQGRNLVYRAAYERMDALMAYLTENCCQGQACLADSAAAACCR